MTASPPAAEQYAKNAKKSAAPGLPSEEEIARAINLAARAMQRQFAASGSEEEIEAAIWERLGPAFEAKDAEARENYQDALAYAEVAKQQRLWKEAAEAKLAQAVEAAFREGAKWSLTAGMHYRIEDMNAAASEYTERRSASADAR